MEVHAYIGVTDLQRGIEFYTRGLGLRLRRRLGGTWVELEGASIPIFLMVVSDRPQGFSGPWTMHLDFLTEHLEVATQQAQDAGAVLLRPIPECEWGRMANLTDPFGNHFDLIELVPGGYDRIAQASDSEEGGRCVS
jgi:predicted enzyme related to lactoylglutathione lyase